MIGEGGKDRERNTLERDTERGETAEKGMSDINI